MTCYSMRMTNKFFIASFLFYFLTNYAYAQTTDSCKAEVDAAVKAATEKTVATVVQTTTPQILPLIINEFMPDPEGTDTDEEWIEIKNPTDQEANLDGWEVDDSEGGSKSFSLKGKIIAAHGFLVVKSKETKIALNNTVDQARLMAPNGQFIDTISYSDTKSGQSYARTSENTWIKEINPTPGAENISKIEIRNEVIPKNENIPNDKISSTEKVSDQKTVGTSIGDLSEDIEISEVFPNPVGPDKGKEWLEIHNTGDDTVNLGSWEIHSTTKKFKIPSNFTIKPAAYMLLNFDDIKLTLKNGPNEIYLIDPEQNEIDSISYDEAPENIAFAKIIFHNQSPRNENYFIPVASAQEHSSTETDETKWLWTGTKTPGKPNPVYAIFEGKISGKGLQNFSVENGKEKILVNFEKQKINPDLIALAVQQQAKVKITGIKKGKNEYELESYEVIQQKADKKNADEKSRSNSYWILALIAIVGIGFQILKSRKSIKFKSINGNPTL